MSLQIAKLIMPKETWIEMTGQMSSQGLTHWAKLLEQEEGIKLNEEKLNKILALILKETEDLCEKKYEKIAEVVQSCMEEVYTDEELEKLAETYKKYPWMLEKSRVLAPMLHAKVLPMSEEIIERLKGHTEINKAMDALLDEAL
jgi:hypothetical protein